MENNFPKDQKSLVKTRYHFLEEILETTGEDYFSWIFDPYKL
jgi:hypothetical protein